MFCFSYISNILLYLIVIVSAAEESVAHLEGYSIHKGLQSRQVVFFFMETQLKKAERRNNETKKNKSVFY